MTKPRRNETDADRAPERPSGEPSPSVRARRQRAATRRLDEVLAERGPLTGPITDAGTRALVAVRGEELDGEHGEC